MAIQRWSLVLCAMVAIVLPACISMDTRPITPPDVAARLAAEGAARAAEAARRGMTDFAVYPSRPGETVPARQDNKSATSQKPSPSPSPSPMPIPPGPIAPPGPVVPADAKAPPGAGQAPAILPLPPTRSTPPPEPPLIQALRAHLDGKPERAFEAIATLDRPNQELILAVLPVLARAAKANLASDPVATAVLVEGLESAASRLGTLATIRIDTAMFCEGVSGFGRYQPWPTNRPYRPHDKAQLYLEVRNLESLDLTSQRAQGPRGETYLTQARVRVEVFDAAGKRVPMPHAGDYRQRVEVVEYDAPRYTRAPIKEFYINHCFPVPSTPGVYTAVVTLSDSSGRRLAKTAPVEFRVAGP